MSDMNEEITENMNHSEVLKKRVDTDSNSGLYLWLIIGCSLGGVVVMTVIITILIYIRRRRSKKNSLLDQTGPIYIPGSEFCPQQLLSSFSSSTSDDASETTSPHGRTQRRPLGPSTSLDTPGLLRLTAECVQPRPMLTRWHTVASPHCRTTAISATLDTPGPDRDSDEDEPQSPSSLHGRVWFSLLYKEKEKRLEVTLYKAKHLPGRGLINSPRDPFVKLYLLPDEENFHQSKIRKRTLAPKFNETFVFNVESEDLSKRILRISIYDVDKKKVRHCLGHVTYPMAEAKQLANQIIWKDLETAPQQSSTLGELQLCLSCNPYSNRIKATVGRIRNIQGLPSEDEVLYVRVQLYHGRKMIKTKRTVPQPVSKRQNEMVFDENFNFAVSGRFFDSCSFTFSVMMASPSPLAKDATHGSVVIGPFMYARGEQLQHWQEMLSNPRSMVTRWHCLEAPKRS